MMRNFAVERVRVFQRSNRTTYMLLNALSQHCILSSPPFAFNPCVILRESLLQIAGDFFLLSGAWCFPFYLTATIVDVDVTWIKIPWTSVLPLIFSISIICLSPLLSLLGCHTPCCYYFGGSNWILSVSRFLFISFHLGNGLGLEQLEGFDMIWSLASFCCV